MGPESWGMPYTLSSVPSVTCPHVQSTNSSSAATTSSHVARSSSPSCTRKFGSASYSIWPRSGALPASSWLKKFWYVPELPFGPVCTSTWMSGFASFQVATTSSIPGIQEVNSSVTGRSRGVQSADAASPPVLDAEHPASANVPTSTAATTACFVCCMMILLLRGGFLRGGFLGGFLRAFIAVGSLQRSGSQAGPPEAL